MKKFVFWGAGFWSLFYSFFVFLLLTANLTPDFKSGVDQALMTTFRLMTFFATVWGIQLAFQVSLKDNRDPAMSTFDKVFDVVTTVSPLVTTLFTLWWMSGTVAKVAWWGTMWWSIAWMVVLGILLDVYIGWKGLKYWSGDEPPSDDHHPPAH